MQQKINIEVKLSRNFSTITIGVADEPIDFNSDDEFKSEVKQLGDKLRFCCEEQLRAIGK